MKKKVSKSRNNVWDVLIIQLLELNFLNSWSIPSLIWMILGQQCPRMTSWCLALSGEHFWAHLAFINVLGSTTQPLTASTFTQTALMWSSAALAGLFLWFFCFWFWRVFLCCFFFWNGATCFFAVMFQHSLLEGFSGLEVCCQDMYYMGLEVMNVKISLKKKKKWISNQGDPPRPELPPKKSGWQLMSRKTLVMAQNHLYEHHADNAYMQHDAQKVYPSILTLSLVSNHTRTEPPYVFSSKLLLIVLQMALNQALDCIWILPAAKSQPGSQNIPIWTLPPTSLGSFWSKIRQGFAGLMWCFIRNAWPCHADGASLMFYRILGALSQAIALQLLGEKAVCCVLAGISPC